MKNRCDGRRNIVDIADDGNVAFDVDDVSLPHTVVGHLSFKCKKNCQLLPTSKHGVGFY